MKTTTNTFKLNAVMASLLLSTAATAQVSSEDDNALALEVIEVTAQKRTQSVKDVPLSISAVDAEKLQEANIGNTEDLSSRIGNFSVSKNGQGFNVIMRGLGSGPNQGFEQTVGTYVDGIYRGRGHLMRSGFLDLERIEVLRGPQSILFGKNTTAGALNISSARATDYLDGYINANYEFSNGYTLEGAVSNALADNVQGRIALRVVDKDGWMTNQLRGEDSGGDDSVYGRITLAWQPSDDIGVTFRYQRDDGDFSGGTLSQGWAEEPLREPGVLPGIYGDPSKLILDDEVFEGNPALNEQLFSEFEADHYTLQIDWDLDNLTLTSITGMQEYTYTASSDGDSSPFPGVFREFGEEKFEQLSQEIRVVSNYDNGINFIAGAYFQTSELDYKEDFRVYAINVLGPRDFTTDSDTQALFGQVDFEINEKWAATIGLRYSNEDKDGTRDLELQDLALRQPLSSLSEINVPRIFQRAGLPPVLNAQNAPVVAQALGIPIPNIDAPTLYLLLLNSRVNVQNHSLAEERSEEELTPSVNLRYKFDGGNMAYASISQGTKAGGFDSRSNVDKDFQFEDESVTSYEIGAKLTLDDGAADLNVALFMMKFDDLQTSIFDGSTGFFVKNGGKSTTLGMEVDGRWRFAENWMLSGSMGLLDFEWDEFIGAKCFRSATAAPDDNVLADGSCDLSGKTNAFSPDVSGSFNIDYFKEVTDSLELKANLEVIYKSDYFTNGDLNPYTKQDSYAKLNARIALISLDSNWTVALLGKNLTDEEIITYSTDMPFSPAGLYNGTIEQTRSFELQFSYRFE